jgi:phospholipase C
MAISDIRHFVVLVMENRSFDHLFGYLDLPNSDNLLGGGPYACDGKDGGPEVPVGKSTGAVSDYLTNPDPGHDFPDVQVQIYGKGGPALKPTMRGFVQSYAGNGADVLRCFRPADVPVFSALARNFVLCDRWFSSLPSSTWPNRYFLHTATSLGRADIDGSAAIDLMTNRSFDTPTVFRRLEAHGAGWRVYFHNPPHVSTITDLGPTLTDNDLWREYDPGNGLRGFAEDTANNDLPYYTFIEPQFDPVAPNNPMVPDNSGHPPGDFRRAQQLVREVYNALRESDLWHTSALVVLFDEHGGFYDHAVPPGPPEHKIPAPDGSPSTVPGFAFDRLGPRVPALVISPWVAQGVVDHGPDTQDGKVRPDRYYDHASLVATLLRSVKAPPLTQRDGHAFDFSHLFLDDWRHDCVPKL